MAGGRLVLSGNTRPPRLGGAPDAGRRREASSEDTTGRRPRRRFALASIAALTTTSPRMGNAWSLTRPCESGLENLRGGGDRGHHGTSAIRSAVDLDHVGCRGACSRSRAPDLEQLEAERLDPAENARQRGLVRQSVRQHRLVIADQCVHFGGRR